MNEIPAMLSFSVRASHSEPSYESKETRVNNDQSPGVNDDMRRDKPTLKLWRTPIVRLIPLRLTQSSSGTESDGLSTQIPP